MLGYLPWILRCHLLVILVLISPDFATCSLVFHKHMVNHVIKRLSTFACLALSTLALMFLFPTGSKFDTLETIIFLLSGKKTWTMQDLESQSCFHWKKQTLQTVMSLYLIFFQICYAWQIFCLLMTFFSLDSWTSAECFSLSFSMAIDEISLFLKLLSIYTSSFILFWTFSKRVLRSRTLNVFDLEVWNICQENLFCHRAAKFENQKNQRRDPFSGFFWFSNFAALWQTKFSWQIFHMRQLFWNNLRCTIFFFQLDGLNSCLFWSLSWHLLLTELWKKLVLNNLFVDIFVDRCKANHENLQISEKFFFQFYN